MAPELIAAKEKVEKIWGVKATESYFSNLSKEPDTFSWKFNNLQNPGNSQTFLLCMVNDREYNKVPRLDHCSIDGDLPFFGAGGEIPEEGATRFQECRNANPDIWEVVQR